MEDFSAAPGQNFDEWMARFEQHCAQRCIPCDRKKRKWRNLLLVCTSGEPFRTVCEELSADSSLPYDSLKRILRERYPVEKVVYWSPVVGGRGGEALDDEVGGVVQVGCSNKYNRGERDNEGLGGLYDLRCIILSINNVGEGSITDEGKSYLSIINVH